MTEPTTTTRQRVIEGLESLRVGDAARRLGLTPAGYCAARLRTWAQRNGKPLSPQQALVLASCETMPQRLGGERPAFDPETPLRDRQEATDARVKAYAEKHGLELDAGTMAGGSRGLQGAGHAA